MFSYSIMSYVSYIISLLYYVLGITVSTIAIFFLLTGIKAFRVYITKNSGSHECCKKESHEEMQTTEENNSSSEQ